jgi:hypothetical protein
MLHFLLLVSMAGRTSIALVVVGGGGCRLDDSGFGLVPQISN